jgi:hypothetical protein
MASIASAISFLMLLLVTYSYSLPIVPEFDGSTPTYEITTGITTVEHQKPYVMELVKKPQPADATDVHKTRSTGGDSSSEEGMKPPHGSYKQRSVNDMSTEEGTTPRYEGHSERSVNDMSPEEDTTPRYGGYSERSLDNMNTEEDTTPLYGGYSERSVDSMSTEEDTTPRYGGYSVRGLGNEEDSFSATTPQENEERSFDENSFSATTPQENEERSFDENSSSSIESSTQFNERSISSFDMPSGLPTATFETQYGMKGPSKFQPLPKYPFGINQVPSGEFASSSVPTFHQKREVENW